MLKNPLVRLLVVYTLWIAAAVFGTSFIYLYFKNAGVAEPDLITGFLFWYSSALLAIYILNKKKYDLRRLMLVGILTQLLSYASLIIFSPAKELLFLYSFLVGTTSFLFWVPFNIMYFELSKGREALLGTVYFSMGPFLALILPLTGAAVIEGIGFDGLFFITCVTYAVLLLVTLYLVKRREQRYDLKECLKEAKGFKTLVFIEGIYGGGTAAVVSVISLFYFKTPTQLGVFLSLTTIFSIIASIIISRISDKTRKRQRYLNIFGVNLGVVTALAIFVGNATGWYVITSLRNLFMNLFYPFTTAIIADNKRDMLRIMVGREWILNAGRVVGIFITLFCTISLSNMPLSLGVLGAIILAYPVVIELKKKHIGIE